MTWKHFDVVWKHLEYGLESGSERKSGLEKFRSKSFEARRFSKEKVVAKLVSKEKGFEPIVQTLCTVVLPRRDVNHGARGGCIPRRWWFARWRPSTPVEGPVETVFCPALM